MARRALVLGSGVIGLTTAVVLAEAGWKVNVWAREFPPDTTSDLAPALWYPHKLEPLEATRRWALASLSEFQRLAETPDVTGVRLVPGHKYFHRPMGPPWWASHVDSFRLLGSSQVPEGCRAGYAFTLPVADMSRYLPYLQARLRLAGGRWEKKFLTSFEETQGVADVVLNCTGLGARELGDGTVFPIRGQVLRVPKLAKEEILLDDDNPEGMIYVIPRFDQAIVGGSTKPHDENLQPDESESNAIRQRASHYFPGLEAGSAQVGLRPGRPVVRLEKEGRLVHCYGHGGSGVSLSWGSAREAAGLID